MIEILQEFYNSISIIDLIYLLITIMSLIKCYNKGFVLSVLAMSKWLLAYILTLIIFLLSDNSNLINGQNIIVDDGWSL